MKVNRDIIQGFIAAVLMSLFALVVVINSKKNSDKEISELLKIRKNQQIEKQQAKLREQTANFKRDSALSVLGKQTKEMNLMNKNFTNLNSNILNMRSVYDKNFNDLKNIQNEKDHIIDAPISEQFDFIAKFRYKEY